MSETPRQGGTRAHRNRRAAVLGAPIAHSLSPALHRAAYAALGLDGWSYEAIECDAAGLPGLIGGLGTEWAGLSLTMPLKRAVLPLLDRAEPLVGQVGGANTVVVSGGARHGYNTDVPGMISALAEAGVTALPDTAAPGIAAPGRAPGAIVLGSGATACAALAALRGIGARAAAVAVRNPVTAGPLLAVAERLGLAVRLVPFGENPGLPGQHVLLSTVPAGAADSYADQIASGAAAPRAVLDVVYDPWPTRLAAAAAAAGIPVASGFDLLLHQAAGQVQLMTGHPAPVAAMRQAGRDALARRRHSG